MFCIQDVSFLTTSSSFSFFLSENFPLSSGAATGWPPSPLGGPLGSPPLGAPPCCWAFSVLTEDGASSSFCSRKLDAARFNNKTFRARFPLPVAVVFSRGVLGGPPDSSTAKPGAPGGPQLAGAPYGPHEEALRRLTEGPPEKWQHFVVPVADFALQHLLQQQQQQQQQQVTSEAVWDLVQQLFVTGERGPHPGGLLLLWNAQETLRTLMAAKPSIRKP